MTPTLSWARAWTLAALGVLGSAGAGLTGLLATAAPAVAATPPPTTPSASTSTSTPPIPPGTLPLAVTQLAGSNRFATAAITSERAFPHGASTAVVVSGANSDLADVLAASYLAAQQDNGAGAPILLVNPTDVPAETSAALTALAVTHIVIVGGTGAVNASVAGALSSSNHTVTRVAGADRFATADAVDSQGTDSQGAVPVGAVAVGAVAGKRYAIVADGEDQHLVDALGASAIASGGPLPVFLVDGPTGRLSSTDLSIMATDGISEAILVGGTAALGAQVPTQLRGSGITAAQEAGPNRSATSGALADFAISHLGFSSTHFDIASGAGTHLVDSLAGGPLGGSQRAPTLVTASVDDAGSVASFASAHAGTEHTADLLGGFGSVDPTALAAIASPSGTPPLAGMGAAEAGAAALLANPSVPPGAVPLASAPAATPPTTMLDAAAEVPACSPLVDDAGYWVIPSTTAQAANGYLQSHPTPGTTVGVTGRVGFPGGVVQAYWVTDRPTTGVGIDDSLTFSVVNLGNGSAGLRADAVVAPSGGICLSSGGGGASSAPAAT
ncbi:MAG: cell wall-binding repeat-containing protein [Acidimicrobiales bacterium]